MVKTTYEIKNEIIAIVNFPFIYFLTEILISLIISNDWSVMHIPEKAIMKEQSASFKGVARGVIESIITPFDISNKPHKNAVIASDLKGEKTSKSSQITEKKTMYPPIITEVIAASLTESVKGFLTETFSIVCDVICCGAFLRIRYPYKSDERICIKYNI